jgi:hypothetical protein
MFAEHSFAVGTSPFHVKGVVYLGALEYFDRSVPGGRAAVVEALEAPALAAFFTQRFLTGSWYDAFPGVPMGVAAAKVAGVPVAEFVAKRARWQAERDTQGVYRAQLKLASATMIVDRVPQLAARYFDFVKIEQEKVNPREYLAVITGVPASLASLYVSLAESFLAVAMETAGARNIRFVWGEPEPDGTRSGVRIVLLRRHLQWE